MKNKKGFTLIELLAVIVILAIILIIATTNVMESIKDSKIKAKYTAAKEITSMAEAYIETRGIYDPDKPDEEVCVLVEKMVDDGYLESDVTNPLNGENRSASNTLDSQKVCKNKNSKQQDGYEIQNGNKYNFDGYYYTFN